MTSYNINAGNKIIIGMTFIIIIIIIRLGISSKFYDSPAINIMKKSLGSSTIVDSTTSAPKVLYFVKLVKSQHQD